MSATKRLPATGMLLLASAYGANAWAAECLMQRGYAGIEGIASHTTHSLWTFDDPAFRNNRVANLYTSVVGRCTLTDSLSIKAQASGEYAFQAHQPGTLEDKQNQGLAILNEMVVSWAARDNLYVDLGKLRKTSGYLFSVAPLDLLRNTSGNMRSVRVYGLGDSWRNLYDEGAFGISSTLYRDEGTYTLAALPRLKRNDKRREAASEWDALLRTNSSDRYYASYTSTGLNKFNPTISLLAGSQKTLALGTSGNLTDRLILSVEGSVSQGETWRHLDSDAARAMRNFDYRSEPYRTHSQGVEGDIGVGLRYTTDDQTEFGAEYYGQSQGYSRSEWRNNFDTIKFVNGGYTSLLPPMFITPALRDGYQQYSRMMAAEMDNVGRAGHLSGKHYLTLYTRTNKEQVGRIDWSVSGMANLVDHSTVLNLHLSTPLKHNIEVYTGVAASFGSKESEFGTFGEKGNLYAGMRISW
ncbi:hypothetical protein ACQKDS_08265 [Serratia sp. NPDC078593]|uniref:hypothetical protein n=1 Tax=unclassified Serratia (in: enterobacteria) TaxID=2647522 RepID=UPI0037CCD2D5